MNEVDKHIHQKYDIQRRLGKGAYGIVWKGQSKRSGRRVAIKKIYDAFRNRTDAQRTFREIVFLREFGDHPNIVKLLNVHRADNDKDLYLIFEYMNTDLHHAIRKKNLLKDVHKEYIMYQLFNATKYLHSGNVIHRDQKPSNVLLDPQCNCKIADFGLARSIKSDTENGDDQECLTDYVATRWYRAPEILTGSKHYTKGVDIWSLGCILGELLLEAPLFPGKSSIDQIQRIAHFLGYPKSNALTKMCLNGSRKEGVELKKLEEDVQNFAAVDLLKRLLVLEPEDRVSAEKALAHPYVVKFRNEKREKCFKYRVVPPLNDNVQMSVEYYRKKLYDIIKQK